MKIVGHCIVKNEERFIWYAINSVIDFLDELYVWDTGSTDTTCEIVKSIKNRKIIFEEKGKCTSQRLSELRNEMIEKTKADWIFVIDGDEIWHRASIKEIINLISKYKNTIDAIVSPVKMLIGDIYHYQSEKAGRYEILDRKGHYNIRAIRNTKGLAIDGVYPNEAYVNKDGTKIQNLSKNKIIFSKNYYFHASHLRRSSKDRKKFKYDKGIKFPLDYYYPEIFFEKTPKMIDSVFTKRNFRYETISSIIMPFKVLKRSLI
ncbi:glycosyltransferase [Patescibacteria group bacterium]